jgi:hypothetical protein
MVLTLRELARKRIEMRLAQLQQAQGIPVGPIALNGLAAITAVALAYKYFRVVEELYHTPPEERNFVGVMKRLVFAL